MIRGLSSGGDGELASVVPVDGDDDVADVVAVDDAATVRLRPADDVEDDDDDVPSLLLLDIADGID